jgi:TrpR family transcriptional regulator, trp operon repressor
MYWHNSTLLIMNKNHLNELFELFPELKTVGEAESFLRDMLTPYELEQVAERWQIVKGLSSGKSQRQVKKELGVSIDKVTRGAKAIKDSKGGFNLFL